MSKPEFRAELKKVVLEALKEYSSPHQKLVKEGHEEYSNMKEVTEHFRVSKPTIYSWIKKGLVTSYKFGGRVLFKIKEIEEKMSSPFTKHLFGKDRDYNYRNVLLSQEQKDSRRYRQIDSYKVLGKIPTKDDLNFYEKYCNQNNLDNKLGDSFTA